MNRVLLVAALIVIRAAMMPALAAEALPGTWQLDSQEINGEKANAGPLTLKISQAVDKLTFAFFVNNTDLASMTYTVQLDGSEADVKNAKGDKVGTIRMTRVGVSRYKLTLKGPHRPDSSGTLTVSPDGKTLTSETDSIQSNRPTHSKQVFSRSQG